MESASCFPRSQLRSQQAARCRKKVAARSIPTHGGSFSAFLRALDTEAGRYGVEKFPLGGATPYAVLLYDPELTDREKEELRRTIERTAARRPPHGKQGEAGSSPHPAEGFRERLARELEKVRKSRIPCALMMVRLGEAVNGFLQQTADLLQQESGVRDPFVSLIDRRTLALLLPGLNRATAIERAGHLHRACSGTIADKVCVGLNVCGARQLTSVEEFISTASRQLDRAESEGWGVFHAFEECLEESCQVTVEERTQLFSFLRASQEQ